MTLRERIAEAIGSEDWQAYDGQERHLKQADAVLAILADPEPPSVTTLATVDHGAYFGVGIDKWAETHDLARRALYDFGYARGRASALLADTPTTEQPRWRVGRTSGRTLYRDEVSVGRCDTREVAAEVVERMNRE